MQNKYVGDIGDYSKFGLLRSLSTNLKDSLLIGVNWYFVKEADNDSDGKFIEYLGEMSQKSAGDLNEYDYENRSDKPKIRDLQECDFDLIKELRRMVWNNRRDVSEFMEKNILKKSIISGMDVKCYADELEYLPSDRRQNKLSRDDWFNRSVTALEGCDIIFTDEDNGVQVDSVPLYSSKGKKYISYNEIEQYYNIGKSIIIYNHHSMEKPEKYLERFVQIKNRLRISIDHMYILTFSKYSGRDYVFIIQSEHHKNIKKAIDEFKKSSWCTTGAFNQKNWERFQQITNM
jgi:hypothetical protein